MFRLVYLTFYGQPRMSHEVERHIHESPRSMTAPLVILALTSITAGWLGWPHSLGGSNRFEKFLEPVFSAQAGELRAEGAAAEVSAARAAEQHESAAEYLLMFLSLAAAGAGWFLAYRAYSKSAKGYTEPIAAAAPPVYNTLYNKYYVDEFYDYAFTGRRTVGGVRLGAMGLGEASAKFDANVIDGTVNGVGWMTRATATLSNLWDKWIIDGLLVNGPAIATRVLSYPVRLVQWGLVQWYALVMVAGLVGFAFWYLVR